VTADDRACDRVAAICAGCRQPIMRGLGGEAPGWYHPDARPHPGTRPAHGSVASADVWDADLAEKGRYALITIEHTPDGGTLLRGSRKGDGVFDLLRPLGWKPFASIGCLGLPNTRDKVAPRRRITTAKETLTSAGFEAVTVDIDDEIRDRATVLAAQGDRLDDRADRLSARADRHAGNADAAWRRADQISGAFEGGQPILVGHHSEKRARADQTRMHNAMSRSVEEDRAAQHAGQQAAAVGTHAAAAARPDATARRIEKQEKELRDLVKHLDGREPTTDYLMELTFSIVQLRDRIAYDRARVAAAIAAGEWVWHTPTTVHVGDVAYSHGGLSGVIAKVNKVTVAVWCNMPWPLPQRYTDLTRVVCTHTTEAGDGEEKS
jgi:hypothetical protein